MLYNLQFDDAEKLFQEIVSESPDRPVGYFYLAMVIWSRMVAGFWSSDVIDEYKARIDVTIRVAENRIKRKAADSVDYFYLGGALGFMGRFELMRKNWFASFKVSRKAIHAMETCAEMDPDNRDVLLGIGTFDYYTAKMSGVLRFLSFFLLHNPDRQEGLRKLHIAAQEAIFSRSEAKSVLLNICLFLEDDCREALSLAKELGAMYAQDPSYRHFQGVAAIRLGNDLEYQDAMSYLRQRSAQAFTESQRNLWQRRALYLESVFDLYRAQYAEARSKLEKILSQSDPETDPAMIAWPIVKIGMTYDLERNRAEAKEFYNKVKQMRNGSGAQFMAEKCLRNPITAKDTAIGY